MNNKMNDLKSSFEATFSELEKDLMPEMSKSFEATFSELEKDLMPEVSKSFEATFSDLEKDLMPEVNKTSRKPISRKRLTHREESTVSPNETARYLYDVKHNRFIDWREKIAKYALYKRIAYSEHEAQDLASSFMVWLVKKDKFQGRTSDPIMYHWVQSQMFRQWVSRLREFRGKDGLSRHLDKRNRTQQEKKVGEFTITSSNYASTAIDSTDSQGRVTSEDWFYESDSDPVCEEAHSREIDTLIYEAFASTAESNDVEVETLYEVMDEMMGKSFKSDLEWASAWSLPKKQVKKLKSLVRESFKSNTALREAVSVSL